MKTSRRLPTSGIAGNRILADNRPGMSPVDIADHNSRATLGLLRRFGPLTRQELARHLGLTEPAITGITQRLVDAGLVLGRKRVAMTRYTAVEFAVCPDAAYSLGLRLGTDGCEIVMLDLACSIVRQEHVTGLDMIAEAIDGMIASFPASASLIGCGIALSPEAVSARTAIEVAVGHLAVPLFFLEDSEAAINAERMLGIGDAEGGLVTILIDDTVRAGLFIGGRPFHGMHGKAGEIGEMRSGIDGASLNETATLPSLQRHLAHETSADGWVEIAARHLHEAVLAISGFIAPGAILIGGSLPDDILASVISSMAREREKKIRDLVIAPWIPVVQPATHPKDGVTFGAALRPFNETLFPA
ncbi:ROK family transcriptional regulator [Rhizobium sp. S152]|uniref:ROK family transcriptional regulator n=1 Tax=Rhizobium sp. S152 TaxID=3055038 RepID=UPI0025AA2C27|nr:ROK family transcriptional regulator [Rhizobium sp. S152]MDM9624666.1 ROK family transcriptional regulator [Rhizobium sp. S152]